MKLKEASKFELGLAIMYDGMDDDDSVLAQANNVLLAINNQDESDYIIQSGRLGQMTGPNTKKTLRALYQSHFPI